MTAKGMTETKYNESKRLNQSGLKILDESPPQFKKMLDGELEREETSAQHKGNILHKLLFESESFSMDYKVIEQEPPSNAQRKAFCEELIYTGEDYDEQDIIDAYKNNYSTKSKKDEKIREEATKMEEQYREYIQGMIEGSDKEILSQPVYEEARSGVQALLNHPILGPVLREDRESNGFTLREIPIAWDLDGDGIGNLSNILISNKYKAEDSSKPENEREKKLDITRYILDEENVIPCRSKLDKLDVSFESKTIWITDAKSMGRGFRTFQHYFYENNLHLQAAMYVEAAIKYLSYQYEISKEELAGYHFNVKFAAVDLSRMESRSFKVSADSYNAGWRKLLILLNDYVWHLENDSWECKKVEYVEGGEII